MSAQAPALMESPTCLGPLGLRPVLELAILCPNAVSSLDRVLGQSLHLHFQDCEPLNSLRSPRDPWLAIGGQYFISISTFSLCARVTVSNSIFPLSYIQSAFACCWQWSKGFFYYAFLHAQSHSITICTIGVMASWSCFCPRTGGNTACTPPKFLKFRSSKAFVVGVVTIAVFTVCHLSSREPVQLISLC